MADDAGPVPREAVDYVLRKQLRRGWDYRDVWREEHAVNFTVANMMDLGLLADVQESLAAAREDGTAVAEWKKRWTADLRKRGWWGRLDPPDPDDPAAVERANLYVSRRLDTIWRVNMRQSSQAGRWERGARSSSHPWLLYRVGPSKEHRHQHLAWNGTLLPKDDAFWQIANPSNGWGCKCTSRFVSDAQRRRYLANGVATPVAGDGRPKMMPVSERRPDLRRETYRNERKGITYEGYAGIDPGFEHNPGEGRHEQLRRALRDDTLTIHRRIRPVTGEGLMTAGDTFRSEVAERQEADVARALRALGRLHSMPDELPETVVRTADLPPGVEGRNHRLVGLTEISSAAQYPDLVMLHEVGHSLVDVVKDVPQAAELLAEVLRAIYASDAYDALSRVEPLNEEARERLRRALGANEQFAMAYMVWAAMRSRQRRLLDRIAGIQDAGDDESLRVWGMKDFLAIALAMDKLMIGLGWSTDGS